MPDADLPPIELSDEFIQKARESLPDLPDQLIATFLAPPHELRYDMAKRLSIAPDELAFYTAVFESGVADGQFIFNWIVRRLYPLLKTAGLEWKNSPFTVEYMVDLLQLLRSETITCILHDSVLSDSR